MQWQQKLVFFMRALSWSYEGKERKTKVVYRDEYCKKCVSISQSVEYCKKCEEINSCFDLQKRDPEMWEMTVDVFTTWNECVKSVNKAEVNFNFVFKRFTSVVVVVKMEVSESKVLQMRSDLTPEKIQQFMSALSNHANEHPGKNCLDLVRKLLTQS